MLHFYATLFEKALPFTLCYGKNQRVIFFIFYWLSKVNRPEARMTHMRRLRHFYRTEFSSSDSPPRSLTRRIISDIAEAACSARSRFLSMSPFPARFCSVPIPLFWKRFPRSRPSKKRKAAEKKRPAFAKNVLIFSFTFFTSLAFKMFLNLWNCKVAQCDSTKSKGNPIEFNFVFDNNVCNQSTRPVCELIFYAR